MKRKRIVRTVERVTQSPVKAKEVLIGHCKGKPALLRHGVEYDRFKGVKAPKNWGYAALCDIAAIVQTFRGSDLLAPLVRKELKIEKRYESGKRPHS